MSNAFRTELKAIAVEVSYEAAVITGEQLTYTHRGSDITVYGCPISGGNATDRVTLGTRSQEQLRTFKIPVQTNFPPSDDLLVDDTITDVDGNVYAVRKWNNDCLQACYTFEDCVCTKTKQVGAVGQ